ncbi:TPA: YihA family ribosome biogenesis GTP-binding protein, partial [Listeria monocytogenes]|nr:YihA family ribosome biogenesis GTP-binding protein [Listeria monocytogenes]
MIETYITSREQLRGVIQIVDLRHKPTEDDRMMYEFLKYYDIPVIVIATKADKIPRSKWQKNAKIVRETLDFDPDDKFVLFSSETKMGKDEAWQFIKEGME